MSIKAFAYVRNLTFGGQPALKLVAENIADAVDNDTMSWVISVNTLAEDSEVKARRAKDIIGELAGMGLISQLDRWDPRGQQLPSRIYLHGPWDHWGGTGRPFAEVQRTRGADRRLDVHRPVEVSDEDFKLLSDRFAGYAAAEGRYADGAARARWRLGSRAHSLTCWYGVGRTVVHQGRCAVVAEVSDLEGRTPVPHRVRLEGGEEWVPVAELVRPEPDEQGPAKAPEAPEQNDPAPDAPAPQQGAEASPQSPSPAEDAAAAGTARPSPAIASILGATDADEDEATALLETLRPEAKKSLTGYIRHLASTGDLAHRLWQMREDRRAAARAERRRTGVSCYQHPDRIAPCPICVIEARDPDMRADLENALQVQGAQARPDLAALLGAPAA